MSRAFRWLGNWLNKLIHSKKEDDILHSDIKQEEKIELLHQKLDQIMDEIERLKAQK